MMRVALLAMVAVLPGCRFDTFRFYEVTRTATSECDILPQGDFCVEPEQLSAPVFEVWAVERRGDEVRVLVDEEVWLADPPAADDSETPDRITSAKLEVASAEPGPCTTTTTRSIDLTADTVDSGVDPFTGLDAQSELVGQLNEQTRLTGPPACGDTPRGLRSVASLLGTLVGAP